MLVNIIQNTISSFISGAAAASEVITTNLKMWLGFETSETLGREEVVNGDFALDSDWTEGAGWDIDTANNRITRTAQSGSTSATQNISFVSGKSYSITYTLDVSAGSFLIRLGGKSVLDTPARSVSDTYTEVITATSNHSVFNLRALNGTFAGSISNVSVKELTQITPDKSGNNNVGELFTGKALDFNGSTEYVNTTGFEMAGTSATFAFWIYPKDTAYQFIMDLDGTVRTILGLFNGGSGQVFAFFNSGFKQFGTPIQNQWQRVVFRVNATTVECYVDGVKSGSTLALTSSIDLSTVGNSVIGGRFDTTNAANRFDGSLSDFQIYNAYWSTDDIAFDYANPNILVTDSTNTGTSIAVTNLKAYWAMSEGAGLIAYDSSGEGNNGIINGADYEPAQPRIPQLGMQNWAKSTPVADEITLIPNPTIPTQDILGNAVRDRLNSFNLDGSGYAEVAEVVGLDVTDFSIEAWVKFDYKNSGSTTNVIYVNGGVSTSVDTFALTTDEDNKVRFIVGGVTLYSTTVFSNNNWVYIAGTRESGALKLYINGNKTPEATGTGNAVVNNTLDLLVGRDTQTNRFYKERISDVRLYGAALSSTEIENNYNAGLSAHTN